MKRLVVALAFVALAVLVPANLWAQEEVPRAEIGVSYELFQAAHANSTLGNINFDRKTSGFSFRGTYNVNRWAAVETTFGFQPSLDVQNIGGLPVAGVLTGPNADFNLFHNEYKFKGTARQGDNDQVGLFAFAGPGWLRADPNATLEPLVGGAITKFTFEFGGGIEYYPTRRFGLRLDLSDLVAFLGTINGVEQNTTNNFVLRVGASFRW
jgi:hypothetical protein